MAYVPIVPAALEFNAGGIPWSSSYDDVYHSADGGLSQARHVFVEGSGLPDAWQNLPAFTVLETGFGLGLNFLATWQAWRQDPRRCGRLHYIAIEQHPFQAADLARIHRKWPELTELSGALCRQWPLAVAGCHRLLLAEGRVSLTLVFGDVAHWVHRLSVQGDALFLDGFTPAKNPAMWSRPVLARLTRLAAPGATLTTWCIGRDLRAALEAEGWQLERIPGFGHKREMLQGRRPGARPVKAAPGTALVLGAGIAGCTAANALVRRGWQVTLVDRHPGPGREASGNPAGILHPTLSLDDNISARLSRACALYGLRLLHALEAHPGLRWQACGVVQIARNDKHEILQRDTIARLGLPKDYADFIERTELSQRLGRPAARGGWLFPGCGWLSPPTVCKALVDGCGSALQTIFDQPVARLRQTAFGWAADSDSGQALAEAQILVLASGWEAGALMPALAPALPFRRVRGQISLLPAETLAGLPLALCGHGYVTPPAQGVSCLGASFDFDDDDRQVRLRGHEDNLLRLEGLLPGSRTGLDAGALSGRVGFRTATPDRLPVAGALADPEAHLNTDQHLGQIPRWKGLFGLLGLGSRGMMWAPLMAELLAANICGEPLPLESELVAAVDPARFLLRAWRKNR